LDNDADAAVQLFSGMLAQREQWLKYLVGHDPATLRADLERALRHEIETALASLHDLFPRDCASIFVELLDYASGQLASEPERAAALRRCADRRALPSTDASAVDDWTILAKWLLTKNGEWRSELNAKQGVPARRDAMAQRRRAQAADLLSRCRDVRGLSAALHAVEDLPSPVYDDASWDVVAAILELLPRLAARLVVTFAESGASDFAQALLAALDALGLPDAPS